MRKPNPLPYKSQGGSVLQSHCPSDEGVGGELPRSAPHGGWVSADPLSRPLPPLQAVAAVCGFLIVILLCLICFFAQKTRSKIWRYGKANIYWDRAPVVQEGPDVEEWVSAGGVAMGTSSSYPEQVGRWGRGRNPPAVPHCQELLLPQTVVFALCSAAPGAAAAVIARSRGAELPPHHPFFFPLSLKGKQGWIRWAGGQQCRARPSVRPTPAAGTARFRSRQ